MRLILVLLLILAAPLARAVDCWPLTFNPARLALLPDPGQGQYHLIAVWTCPKADGTGYVTYRFAFSGEEMESMAQAFMAGTLTKASADAAYAATATPETAADTARLDAAAAPYAVRAQVATNGSATTRSVYRRDSANRLSIVWGQKAAVGAPCVPGRRVPGTSYYSVQGTDNAATSAADALGDVYAVCTVTAPTGVIGE